MRRHQLLVLLLVRNDCLEVWVRLWNLQRDDEELFVRQAFDMLNHCAKVIDGVFASAGCKERFQA